MNQSDERSRKIVFLATANANFISAYSINSMNLALPTLAALFDVSANSVSWLTLLYTLIPCCMMLFFGRVGDVIGYKKQYTFGFLLFGLISLLMPIFSVNLGLLITFRCLQAFASSIIVSITQAIVTTSFPASERGKALGTNTIFVSLGLAAGPTIGGLILTYLGWKWIIWINVPFCVLGAIASVFVIKGKEQPNGKDSHIADKTAINNKSDFRAANMDIPGTLLFAVSMIGIVVGLTTLGSLGPSLKSGLMMVVGILFLFIFIKREMAVESPLMPLELFKNKTFTVANIVSILTYMTQQMITYLMPFYLVVTLGYISSRSGLIMLAAPLAMMFVSRIGGKLSDKRGIKFPAIIGFCILLATTILMSFLPREGGGIMALILMGMMGTGNGFCTVAINSAIFSGVPKEHMGVGSGMVATMRNMGQTMGVAFASIVITIAYNLHKGTGSFGVLDTGDFLYHFAQRDTFLLGGLLIITAILLVRSLPKNAGK